MPISELNELSIKILQPNNLTIKLKEHQLTSIYAMNSLEEKGFISKDVNTFIDRYHIYTDDNYYGRRMQDKFKKISLTIHTNFGILSDVVGSGKTYIMMGLINHKLIPVEHDRILPSSMFCSMKYKDIDRTIKTNFIIVPHNLVTQWKIALSYTKLKSYIIARHTDINYLEFADNIFLDDIQLDIDITKEQTIEYYDVIVCSANMIADYLTKFKNVKYSRIIIDEICSIKLPLDLEWKSNFIWFITATPSGISRINKQYIKYIVSGMHNFVFDSIIIKNNDEYVSKSMSLPKLNQYLIKCFTPKQLELLRDHVPQDVLDMLNAGNMTDAINRLNCNMDTNENILEVLTRKLIEEIHNRTIELQYQESLIIQNKKTHDEHIGKLKNNLNSVQTRYDTITTRIKSFKEENCPICLEELLNGQVCVLPCCNQLFCITCIANIMNKTCPSCRAILDLSKLYIINDETKKKELQSQINKEITKIDAVIKIIKSKSDAKFLLFSNYDQTFIPLLAEFDKNKINHSKVMGTINTINKTIEHFISGEIQVLLLNASQYGSGLNLQMATDIIIYHELSLELETQVIGRAQRIGRVIPLNVYYLLFNHEHHNVDNPILSLDLNIDEGNIEFDKHLNICKPQEINYTLNDEEIPPEIYGDLFGEKPVEKKKKGRKPKATNPQVITI